jgi:hypothetical protein
MIVNLRDTTMDDAGMILGWRNRPEIADQMFNNDPIELDNHLRGVESALDSAVHKYWTIECEGHPVGVVNLDQIALNHRRCSRVNRPGIGDCSFL